MRKNHLPILLVAALSVSFGSAHAASVHSAAGVVPPLPNPQTSQTPDTNRSYTGATTLASLSAPTTPPPLPPTAASQSAEPVSTSDSDVSFASERSPAPPRATDVAHVQATPPVQAAAPTQPATPAPVFISDFDKALTQTVTIDVVDMRLEDLLQQLVPTGWRMRVQNVPPATLDQRVDLTAQATRGDVLHELLGQSSLTIKPFDGFDVPLMLITTR